MGFRNKEAFVKQLEGVKARARPLLRRALYAAGQMMEVDAETSITRGSISGAGHVPSAPHEPPNADTRYLDTNIDTKVTGEDPIRVEVTSHAPYSAALEWGTSKMIERPYMRPAFEKNKDKMAELIQQALERAIRGD
jgi:HK97 gp10 family phage protein